MLVTSGISGIDKPLRFAKRPSKESGPTILPIHHLFLSTIL